MWNDFGSKCDFNAKTVTQTDDAAGKDRLNNSAIATNTVTVATVNTSSVKLSEDEKLDRIAVFITSRGRTMLAFRLPM